MQPLIGDDTTIVSGVNGVPWWYFHGLDGPLAGTRLESVDPGGVQWDGFGPERVLGCVVYPAAEVSRARHHPPHRGQPLLAGRALGREVERATRLSRR
jgi:2-dehydropantoate 2-reductase